MALFGAAQGWGKRGGQKRFPLLEICHTYPKIMKLDTTVPYLKKIQKLYKSCGTLPEFC